MIYKVNVTPEDKATIPIGRVAENEVTEVAFDLATPTTVQLSPTEITTLLGDNNVWADTGDVSLEYVRDWNIVINKLLGE